MIELKAVDIPERLVETTRKRKIEAVRAKHAGKLISQMTKSEQDELLEAIAQIIGIADENGNVI